MARADDHSPRARLDAAVDLCGVDLILRMRTRRQPPQIRGTAIQNDGARPPGAAVSTRRPTHRAS
jgi:hypothetical protein